MELEAIKNLKISDLIEFAPFMGMKTSEALPMIKDFINKHGLSDKDIRCITSVVTAIGLY